MNTKPKSAKPLNINERPSYSDDDVKRDMIVSGGTIFAFSTRMDLSIDQTKPKHGTMNGTAKKTKPAS